MRSRMLTIPLLMRSAIVALLAVIALSGTTALRVAPQDAEAAFLAEVKKLLASDAEAVDHFGTSLAISGNTAVVGSYRRDAGAVYLFQRDLGGAYNWGELKKLTASDAEDADDFGRSVAITSDLLIVGAADEDAGGNAAGAAYIFLRDEGGTDNWGEVKKLTASDAQAGDEFGASVAVSGGTVVVGARDEDGVDPAETGAATGDRVHADRSHFKGDIGAAYVFERDEGGVDNWGEVRKLTASDGKVLDSFGAGVTVSGDSIIVGIDRGLGVSVGAAYIYQRDEGGANNWGEIKKLIHPQVTYEGLGSSVALDGDTAVVGASTAPDINAGAAYVFERDLGGADNWGGVTQLRASDQQANDYFGGSVAISGDRAVVGACCEDTVGVGMNAGAAYVFERDEGGADNWGEVEKLTASDAMGNNYFGASVAVSGVNTLIGAHGQDEAGNLAGAAYVLETAVPGDTDQDGCGNKAENGPDETLGGQRANRYFWDFYDVWTHPFGDPIGWERNKVVNVFDILGVAARFGPGPQLSKEDALAAALTPPLGEGSYHAAYDRGSIIGANNWNRAPADGAINIVDDILGVAAQFGHNCS